MLVLQLELVDTVITKLKVVIQADTQQEMPVDIAMINGKAVRSI